MNDSELEAKGVGNDIEATGVNETVWCYFCPFSTLHQEEYRLHMSRDHYWGQE